MELAKEVTKKQAKQELATKQTNLPSVNYSNDPLNEATSTDIIIPKLLLMHGLSKLVAAGKKNQGDLIKSDDESTLAKRGETIQIVPLSFSKSWRISEVVPGQQNKWKGEIPRNASNDDLPWDDVVDGKAIKRDRAYNFYAMLCKDMDAGTAFPIRLQFLRTSSKAGQILADHFAKSKMFNKDSKGQTFTITAESETKENKTFLKFSLSPGAATSPKHLEQCTEWAQMLAKNIDKIKDHEVDNEGEELSGTATKDEF
jgi:hypothetical protein